MRVPATWRLGLAILFGVTIALYWPGLRGPFLFDDYANLPALGHQGTIDTLDEAVNFIRSGIAGPSGRPLALASFLLDGRTWPSDPYPFKRTNLLIHLLCGLALLALCRQLLKTPGLAPAMAASRMPVAWIALLAAGLWLLHPINVSTTLYVVQRMAQLAALFSILGLAAYVYGRQQLALTPRRGACWMGAGIIGGTGLGILCKENAVIVPVLALTIERLCFPTASLPRLQRAWTDSLTLLPSLALLGYFIYLLTLGRVVDGYASRDFSLSERLLTQPRAILEYLYMALWPWASSRGLYGDSFAISNHLFSPASTLPSLIGLLSLLALSLTLPQRWQAVRLAVLFFLAGHLLEGSIIPLELYFEHRNYLPVMLLPLALCLAIAGIPSPSLRLASLLIVMGGTAAALAPRVTIWTDQLRLVLHAAQLAPHSVRVNLDLANLLEDRQQPAAAGRVFAALAAQHPDQAELALIQLLHQCRQDTLGEEDIERVAAVLGSKPFDPRIVGAIEPLATYPIEHKCAALTPERALDLLDRLLASPGFRNDVRRAQVAVAKALLWIHAGDSEKAVQAFEAALKERYVPDVVLVAMRDLAVAGHYCEAQAILVRHEPLVAGYGQSNGIDYGAELRHFKALLASELANQPQRCANPATAAPE